MLGKVVIAAIAFFVLIMLTMKALDLASTDTYFAFFGFIAILIAGWGYWELVKFLFISKKSTKNEQK